MGRRWRGVYKFVISKTSDRHRAHDNGCGLRYTRLMQLTMPFAVHPSYHAHDFVRGEANAQALNWIERWPDWPYSIVLVHGARGSGKTHLAHVFAAQTGACMIPTARIGHVTADMLLTGNHVWVLDDVDQVQNEAALAQLINHARARGDYMLLTSGVDAPSMAFTLPDLRSRLAMLPSIALGAPDDALLMGVLAKNFADRQLRVDAGVLEFAVTRLERSYSALHHFAEIVDQRSLATGRAVTLVLVREVLSRIT